MVKQCWNVSSFLLFMLCCGNVDQLYLSSLLEMMDWPTVAWSRRRYKSNVILAVIQTEILTYKIPARPGPYLSCNSRLDETKLGSSQVVKVVWR